MDTYSEFKMSDDFFMANRNQNQNQNENGNRNGIQTNTYEELEKAYDIELERIEKSIGQKLTQEFYDTTLESLNADDFYTITFIRQAADSALEEMCDVEVTDDQHGYALFIGGRYYGLYNTMVLAQEAFQNVLNDNIHTFKVPVFPSIIPLQKCD
jgi:hypothetical protein